jgi:hypothetical protein
MPKPEQIDFNYKAVPTAQKFHHDDSFARIIKGPRGSSKSVMSLMEMILRGCRQAPNSQGVRNTKFGVVRNTYSELTNTTLATIKKFLPDPLFSIKGKSPIYVTIQCPGIDENFQPDDTWAIIEAVLVSIDRPEDIKKLLSFELTGIWFNELREISKAAWDQAGMSVGRYPDDAPITWSGIWGDTNPPDDDHWIYALDEERPKGLSFYHQPPALLEKGGEYIPNPEAENIVNLDLGYDYYIRNLPGKTKQWINVYIMGYYGTDQAGKPVYPEYNDTIHCSPEIIQPNIRFPLIVGLDFGLTPVAVFVQKNFRGQALILDELQTWDMGARQFCETILKPHIAEKYKDFDIIYVGDKVGGNQRDQIEKKTVMQVMRKELGIPIRPGRSSVPEVRQEAVRFYLTRMDMGTASFLLSPNCKVVRKGLIGGYKFKRVQISGEERYKSEPDKNKYSHAQDALQDSIMELKGLDVKNKITQTMAEVDYDPMGFGTEKKIKKSKVITQVRAIT